jgi:hypothetical protein
MLVLTSKTDDLMPFLTEPMGVRIDDSAIHGKGIFATKPFQSGEIIAPARKGGKRTPAARYCNHGGDPNAKMVMHSNGDVDLIALKAIEPNTEILSDYFLNFIKTRVEGCR